MQKTFDLGPYLQGHKAMTLQEKLPKYCTFCNVCYMAPTFLHGFFPYLAQITTIMSVSHIYNNLILTYIFKVIQS